MLTPGERSRWERPQGDWISRQHLAQLPQPLLLKRLGWKRAQVFGVENRGRDMAPFLLHLLPAAVDGDHQLFVKVHTKRSLTRRKDSGVRSPQSVVGDAGGSATLSEYVV